MATNCAQAATRSMNCALCSMRCSCGAASCCTNWACWRNRSNCASLLREDQFIVTCRSSEYADAVAAARVLASAAVIEPEPLSPDNAADYLASCLLSPALPPAWQDVLSRLRDGQAPRLAEATSTPLGLWLVRMTYVEAAADPSALVDPVRFPHGLRTARPSTRPADSAGHPCPREGRLDAVAPLP
ncbi:hypothetical protein [Streptomyces sp. NPDC006446]|uniref:hypothetical protein n=1 Tax=Streptomyces sp. NPDC006446 TaxID=3154301 RepID=UPI0033AEC419